MDSHTDTINDLPKNLIETILSLMPIRDAVRTSILSSKWRYNWASIPKLVFNNQFLQGLTDGSNNGDKLSRSRKLFYAIHQVLLLHHGPLLDFELSVSDLQSCSEVDQTILHLSRGNTVKKFWLDIGYANDYKLPASFFSLQHLTSLHLQNCTFQPPSTFCGFRQLSRLYFYNVNITAQTLQLVICNCPRVLLFTLLGNERHFSRGETSCVVELFGCLPKIQYLCTSPYPIKCFAVGGMPRKLPIPLLHLKWLNLFHVCLMEPDDLSFVLLLIRSSPNLKKIWILMTEKYKGANVGASQNFVGRCELLDYAEFSLDHLERAMIRNFSNVMPELEFVKLILAKSPMLREVLLLLDYKVEEELKILKDLIELPRASPMAQIICKRLGTWLS